MPKVLIVYGNHDAGYYNDAFRTQDWTEWEEVTEEEYKLLSNNMQKLPTRNYESAYLLTKADYSAKDAVETIKQALERLKKEEEERKQKAQKAALKRKQTVLENKKKQLEKLKKELGEE